MKRFYSKTTQTTYIKGLHTDMPADCVEISDAIYNAVIAKPAAGKVRSHDSQGLPILIDPAPPTADALAAAERDWRDTELTAQQWLRDRHRDEQDLGRPTTLTSDQFVALLSYLQALRDWPQSALFPAESERPVAPPWIAEQAR